MFSGFIIFFFPSQTNKKIKENCRRLNMWRISEKLSSTVKSSYFEKGAVQWIVCIEKKKKRSVCLKYANVVLLLYDALNLTENFLALLWWSLLPRGCWGIPSLARLSWGGEGERNFSSIMFHFQTQALQEGVQYFLLAFYQERGLFLEATVSPRHRHPVQSLDYLPTSWNNCQSTRPLGFLSHLYSQVLFQCVVTLFCKIIYKSLCNCGKETGRGGPNRG